jgi:glycerate dehydrogenase
MAKIVVLDGYALNPGDLSWKGLEEIAEVKVYDRTDASDVLKRADGFDIILTNKVVITAEHIKALPSLRYIGVTATGYNVVDTEAAKQAGVVVTNIPAYSTESVAQKVFALILAVTTMLSTMPT